MHQIGEVAEAVGLSMRTIRYYEEAELVLPSSRSMGGSSLYMNGDIDRLCLVKQMRPRTSTSKFPSQCTPGQLVDRRRQWVR
jgi:DNA-binding transcriptional MerR regulator